MAKVQEGDWFTNTSGGMVAGHIPPGARARVASTDHGIDTPGRIVMEVPPADPEGEPQSPETVGQCVSVTPGELAEWFTPEGGD
jgi:hypothetical protein